MAAFGDAFWHNNCMKEIIMDLYSIRKWIFCTFAVYVEWYVAKDRMNGNFRSLLLQIIINK